jgi:hypothetical protein
LRAAPVLRRRALEVSMEVRTSNIEEQAAPGAAWYMLPA